ncbi:MAG TPA: hypothetical protein VGU61_06420 [Noviherbaspirillum sp.]|nr:hypothetical protein [Noviherbaspirillum sp.]HEV2609883.1 hypothetical protein [Noviherbaspirillum sp.]
MDTQDVDLTKRRVVKHQLRVAKRKRFIWASIAAGVAWVVVATQFLK